MQAAWNKYGADGFDFSIIEEMPEDMLVEREIYWIEHFDALHSGYNRSGGGDGTTSVIHSDERGKKISESLSGRKRPEISGANSFNARSVVCLNTGEKFECVKDAAKKLSIHYVGILRSCALGCTVGDGLVFVDVDEYEAMTDEDIQSRIENAIWHKNLKHTSRNVVCLNTGEHFNSADDACARYGIKASSCVHNCCKGKTRTSGKDESGTPLVWMYVEDYDVLSPGDIDDAIESALSHKALHRAVRCVETGDVYKTIYAAAKAIHVNDTTFTNHINTEKKYVHTDKDGNVFVFELVA